MRNTHKDEQWKLKKYIKKNYFQVTAVPGVCVRPADVVNGNVSELLVHGRLVFPA